MSPERIFPEEGGSTLDQPQSPSGCPNFEQAKSWLQLQAVVSRLVEEVKGAGRGALFPPLQKVREEGRLGIFPFWYQGSCL